MKNIETKENEIISSPRKFGKNLEAFQTFIIEGRKGKSTCYATPQGIFGSPKYIQDKVEEAQKEARELAENDYEIGFTDGWQEACNKYGLDYDVRLMLIASRKKIKEFKESITPVERISEEKPSTDI